MHLEALPHGMQLISGTTMYVHKSIADINDVVRPHCFRTDNGGEPTSRSYVDYCDSAGVRRSRTRMPRVRPGAQ